MLREGQFRDKSWLPLGSKTRGQGTPAKNTERDTKANTWHEKRKTHNKKNIKQQDDTGTACILIIYDPNDQQRLLWAKQGETSALVSCTAGWSNVANAACPPPDRTGESESESVAAWANKFLTHLAMVKSSTQRSQLDAYKDP